MEEQAKNEVLRQAEAFAEIQTRITDATRQLLATLASLPDFRSGNVQAMSRILRSVHAQNYDYLNFTVVDAKGIIIASSLLASGIDLSERVHIAAALRDRRFSAGNYMVEILQETPSFSFGYPLLDDSGTVAGVVNAVYKLESYRSVFNQLSLPENSFLGIVDRKGIRLYYYPAKESNPVGGAIKSDVWETITAGKDRGLFVNTGSDGMERYFSYRKLRLDLDQEPYVYVVYGVPTAAASASARSVLMRNIILMSIATVLAVLLAAAFSQIGFGRRLADIVRTAEAIREGELSARTTTVDDSPDLGRIGAAVNLMAQTIEKRHRELEEYGSRLSQALEEKNVLLREVHHRVKNNLQLILSMFRLQSDAPGDPALFREAMENRIASMALVHEMLYQSENRGEVELSAYAERIAELVIGGSDLDGNIRLDVAVHTGSVKLERAVPFGLLVNELITNCLKHGFVPGKPGVLSLLLEERSGRRYLEVGDNGPGLPPDFDPEQSAGLGLRLAGALAAQLGGSLQWRNEGGARFSVEFPL